MRNPDGGPNGDRKKLMRNLCEPASVRYFRYHALRHLTASMLDDLGVPIGVIQRILGHQNRRTTEIYLHSIGEAERDAMSKLEAMPLFQTEAPLIETGPINKHMAFWHRKVKQRPSYRLPKRKVDQFGYTWTGIKCGVNDNAVGKWLKAYQSGPKMLQK